MKPRPIVRVLGMVLILSALVFVIQWGREQFVVHGGISITKNADFAAFGFRGEGSPSNPYVIEGLNIKSSNTLIHIQDTTAYFRIRNNRLTGVGLLSRGSRIFPDGIYLQNVVHGTIDTNIITYCKSGIHLNGSEQTTVAHNTISNCKWRGGISLVESWNNNLAHNTLSDNDIGIRLSSSGQNTLVGNSLVNNGLYISGDHVEEYLQATVAENMVNTRPVIYWQSVSGGTVPPGAGQVLLINTTGVEVTGQNQFQTSIGVLAAFSSHLTIHHNTFSNNKYGISLSHSGNNSVTHNTLFSNTYGISLWDARHTTISNNTLSQNRSRGIDLMSSDYNTVAHNTVSGGKIHLEESGYNTITTNTVYGSIGIYYGSRNNTITHNTVSNFSWPGINLRYAEYNTVAHNTVSNCEDVGIHLSESGDNTLFNNTITNCEEEGIGIWNSWHNTIANNIVANCTEEGIVLQWADSRNNMVTGNDFLGNHPGGRSQASDAGPNNVFARNFWADHDNTDRNGDGIADTPYAIEGDASNQDPFPLSVPANIPHSLSAPTIAYPNGGETLQGTVTLHWTPTSDTWRHSVTYAVSYSADDGQTWISLASGLTHPRYEWNTTTVEDGSAYRVRVVATCADGLAAADVSDAPFTIQNQNHVVITMVAVAMLLVTFLLLLAMHEGRRGKRQAR